MRDATRLVRTLQFLGGVLLVLLTYLLHSPRVAMSLTILTSTLAIAYVISRLPKTRSLRVTPVDEPDHIIRLDERGRESARAVGERIDNADARFAPESSENIEAMPGPSRPFRKSYYKPPLRLWVRLAWIVCLAPLVVYFWATGAFGIGYPIALACTAVLWWVGWYFFERA